MKRRIFLEHLLVAGTVTGAAVVQARESVRTPASVVTPMVTANEPVPENDLTRRYQHGSQVAGQFITLTGRVMTAEREPVTGVEVKIWQASVNSVYGLNNRIDKTCSDWRDPDFCLEGQTTTDAQGCYLFHTILPVARLVTERSDPGLGLVSLRAPHIYCSVNRTGHQPFTSQIFFDLFDDINKFDLTLYEKSQEEQRLLIAHVERAGADSPAVCQFDIVV